MSFCRLVFGVSPELSVDLEIIEEINFEWESFMNDLFSDFPKSFWFSFDDSSVWELLILENGFFLL